MSEGNYYDELMADDKEYQRDRSQKYDSKMVEELKAIEDDDEREEIMEVLSNIRYIPSTNPEQDVELNFLRAQKIIKERNRRNRNNHVESFLDWVAKDEGITKKEARKKYKKAMQDTDRTGLSKYGF